MPDTFITIKTLDMDARGVGHLVNEDGSKGKVIFVEGALPGEHVSFTSFKKKKNWEAGVMTGMRGQASPCASRQNAATSMCAAAARCSTWKRPPRSR
jgi:23S rRNA (uracil1939-C5)-methyltransferase